MLNISAFWPVVYKKIYQNFHNLPLIGNQKGPAHLFEQDSN